MKCKFCGRRFPSDQSLYAHFKHCQAYREHKLKQSPSLGQAVPKAASQGSSSSHPAWLNPPDPISSLQPFFEAMGVTFGTPETSRGLDVAWLPPGGGAKQLVLNRDRRELL